HEKITELHEADITQAAQYLAHVIAHRQLLAGDALAGVELGTTHDVLPRGTQIIGRHVRQYLLDRQVGKGMRAMKVAAQLRQGVQLLRGQLHLLVFEQPADKLRTRIIDLFSAVCLFDGQKHAGFDLDQQRRHQQVFSRQLQVVLAYLLDIREILQRDLGHGNIQHIEILLADQLKQKIQQPLEGLKTNLQG